MNNKIALLIILASFSITLYSIGSPIVRKRSCPTETWDEAHIAKLANTMHKACTVSIKRPYDQVSADNQTPIIKTNKKLMKPEDQFLSKVRRFIDMLDEQDLAPLFFLNDAGKLQTEDRTFIIIQNYQKQLRQCTFTPERQDLLKELEGLEAVGFQHLPFS